MNKAEKNICTTRKTNLQPEQLNICCNYKLFILNY